MYMVYRLNRAIVQGATWMIALLVVRDTALRATCTWLWPATDAADTNADADAPNDANAASITRSLDPSDTEDADTSSILSSPCVPHTCICRSHPLSSSPLSTPVPILKRGEFLAGLVFHSLSPFSSRRFPFFTAVALHSSRYHLIVRVRTNASDKWSFLNNNLFRCITDSLVYRGQADE